MDFSNYQTVNILKVADFERAKRGKIYPAGCTLIALSATSGQVEYLDKTQEVSSRWAVIVPKVECENKYMYYTINQTFPRFCHERKTGINFQIEALRHLQVAWHPIEIQKEIVRQIEIVEKKLKKEEEERDHWKDVKKNFLERMML